jgi:transposase-like protein
MIRVFELFSKLNFIYISSKEFFNKAMAGFKPSRHKCPYCKTKQPDWKKHAVYERWLIYYENGNTTAYRLEITRYKCPSCKHTHAILPESIIPYQSYSILFIISVIKDYYTSSLNIAEICTKYDISVSTLYSWKELFLRHKKIWLGLLEDVYTSSLQFLDCLYDGSFLYALEEFFQMAGVSFLQGSSHAKKSHSAPG